MPCMSVHARVLTTAMIPSSFKLQVPVCLRKFDESWRTCVPSTIRFISKLNVGRWASRACRDITANARAVG